MPENRTEIASACTDHDTLTACDGTVIAVQHWHAFDASRAFHVHGNARWAIYAVSDCAGVYAIDVVGR